MYCKQSLVTLHTMFKENNISCNFRPKTCKTDLKPQIQMNFKAAKNICILIHIKDNSKKELLLYLLSTFIFIVGFILENSDGGQLRCGYILKHNS